MSEDKSKENKKVAKKYYDSRKFKGNTFEQNIAAINNMLFGQGIKISDTPFIIIDEKDQKKYLSAYNFKIESKNNKVNINLPETFLQYIFYFNKMLFHFNSSNNLIIIKFINNKCYKYPFPNNFNKDAKCNKEEIKIDESKVTEIKQKLEKINEKSRLTEKYDILFDIFTNDLGYEFKNERPKQIGKEYIVNINHEDFEEVYKCTIKKINLEIDGSGKISEKIILAKGNTSFENGIDSLLEYLETKKSDPEKANYYINNDFKSPIIFKNFDEDFIPKNKVILCEIKSGFAIDGVIKQLEERINIIRDCLFNEEEKPLYYIAIVNLSSENLELIKSYKNRKIDTKEKVLFIVTIDYKYCGFDISHEVHGDYLLYKKMNSIEKTGVDTNIKVTNMEKELTDINKDFKILIRALGHIPTIKQSLLEEKSKIEEEEKKADNSNKFN